MLDAQIFPFFHFPPLLAKEETVSSPSAAAFERLRELCLQDALSAGQALGAECDRLPL